VARILIATVPGSGHVNPMLTVARELVAGTHTVHWYTGRVFRAEIEAAGCHWEAMDAAPDHGGVPVEDAFPRLRGLRGRRYFVESWKEIFIGTAPAQLRDLSAILQRFPPTCCSATRPTSAWA
jgi:UDP:flavonoid glycosyltransferase YjiC (YdhE family)